MAVTELRTCVHSQYSLLDGAIRLKDLFPRISAMGMNAVALTDHGNMFGAIDFYKARAASVKADFLAARPMSVTTASIGPRGATIT